MSATERNRAQLTEFESELIAIFVDMMQTLGLPKSYGEIYGLLYATLEPLGFAEIHQKLSLSKGSVSGGLKALKEIGAIRAVVSQEERRERFTPELELRKLVLRYLQGRLSPQLEDNSNRIKKLELALRSLGNSESQKRALRFRLEKLENWRLKANGLVPWIARFLKR